MFFPYALSGYALWTLPNRRSPSPLALNLCKLQQDQHLDLAVALLHRKVKFADVPNGLAALSKIPALGIFQTVLFLGLVEITIYGQQVWERKGR